MCSWCWGFAPGWRELVSEIPETVTVVDLMGGLAPDNEAPMDSAMRQYVQDAWGAVKARTGAEFNFEFWNKCEPKRSTYPACRAVIALLTDDYLDSRWCFAEVALARMEGKVALEEIHRRIPDYEVDHDLKVRFHSSNVTGWTNLPITFTPGTPE